MASAALFNSVQLSLNYDLKRSKSLTNLDKNGFQEEYREWIEAIGTKNNIYEVLYLNKIKV